MNGTVNLKLNLRSILRYFRIPFTGALIINFLVILFVPYLTYLRPVKVSKIYSIDLFKMPVVKKKEKKIIKKKEKPVPKLPEDTENINKNAIKPLNEEEHVYELEDLDDAPRIIRMNKPDYPEQLRLSGIEGRVVLKFMINYFGHVEKVSVIEQGPHHLFDEKSVEAVKKWEFTPPKVKGRPASVWFIIPIRFNLEK